MGTQIQTPVMAPPSGAILRNWKPSSSRSKQAIPKKKLIRRRDRDYSQGLRLGYQFAFLLVNVWLGGQFYLWVRYYETAGTSAYVPRPAGVEGWRSEIPQAVYRQLVPHANEASHPMPGDPALRND